MFVFVSHLTGPDADHAALERHFRERSHLVENVPERRPRALALSVSLPPHLLAVRDADGAWLLEQPSEMSEAPISRSSPTTCAIRSAASSCRRRC